MSDILPGREGPAPKRERPARVGSGAPDWNPGGVLRGPFRVRRCRVLRVPPDGAMKPSSGCRDRLAGRGCDVAARSERRWRG